VEHRDRSATTPAWLHTHRGAIGQSIRATTRPMASALAPPPATPRYLMGPRRYRLSTHTTNALWTSTVATHFNKLLGTNTLGRAGLILLISSLASSTYVKYDNDLR
jgi:hypothetical protein